MKEGKWERETTFGKTLTKSSQKTRSEFRFWTNLNWSKNNYLKILVIKNLETHPFMGVISLSVDKITSCNSLHCN